MSRPGAVMDAEFDADSTMSMDVATMAKAFQHPRPEIIEIVEVGDFDDMEHLREYCENNVEDFIPEDLKVLYEFGVIGHPVELEEDERVEQEDEPIEVLPDVIFSVGYHREEDFIDKNFEGIIVKEKLENLIERLADIEHQQWMEWSKAVADEVKNETRQRWRDLWIGYDNLDEEQKDKDRKYARKVLEELRR